MNNFVEIERAGVELFPIRARIKKGSKIQLLKVDQTRQPVRHTSGESRVMTREVEKMKAISTLAGGIAHQFNNSLFVITANLELLEMKGLLDTNSTGHIEKVKGAAQRMTEMTRQLLDYARGRKYLAKPISLSDLVRARLVDIRQDLGQSIRVESDLCAEVWKTNADPVQMQTILEALLTNAVEALNDGGRIRISCSNRVLPGVKTKRLQGLNPGAYVSMQIQDNGMGMDEETLRHVFEPFFTTKSIGRGLGLAAAYGIVKNHNGWIGVESKPDQGTIVTIHLPAILAADERGVAGVGDGNTTCTCATCSEPLVPCRCFG